MTPWQTTERDSGCDRYRIDGGAFNEVDVAVTAFPHRDAAYSFGIWAGWSDPERDESVRTRAAYHENNDRLVDLKIEWGPANVSGLDIEPET